MPCALAELVRSNLGAGARTAAATIDLYGIAARAVKVRRRASIVRTSAAAAIIPSARNAPTAAFVRYSGSSGGIIIAEVPSGRALAFTAIQGVAYGSIEENG